MNEDLKIDLYEKVVSLANPNQREIIKDTISILLAKKCTNCFKEIYFYSSDLLNEGFEDFQLEYNIEYANGEFQNGSCIIATGEVMKAFGFKSYNDLKKYFSDKYIDKDDAWMEIIKEMKDKGLEPSIDEDEGNGDIMTNF